MVKLDKLKDPSYLSEDFPITGFSSDFLLDCLKKMIAIRCVEENTADLIDSGLAKTPCHLAIGQEAVPVGVSSALNSSDKVFGCHRSHGHILALGTPVKELVAEILGRVTGCSKGMGGSMHLVDMPRGFYGATPIVGGTISIAVGAALAEKMNGSRQIAVAYFGDGACEEGVLHESLNFASLHRLPILFVCENNLFSSHLDLELRQPLDAMSRFAIAHDIQYALVDGNNVCEVATAASTLISNCRNGNGPAFLEAVTYRFRGHVGPKEDIDVGLKRCLEDLKKWKEKDPIDRLFYSLEQAEVLTRDEYEKLRQEIYTQIADIVVRVQEDPYPDVEQLLGLVYSNQVVHN